MASRILPENITPEILEALIPGGVSEGQTIEFKSGIDLGAGEAKRRLAASVAAFANASGGDIIFGAEESAGEIKSFVGLKDFDADKTQLQLRQSLASNLDPMVPGLRFVTVDVESGKSVLVLRIPRSWNRPHAVIGDNQHFPIREGNRRRHLRVHELREAFGLSASIAEKMRRFRAERVGSLFAREWPLPLVRGKLVIVHLMPQAAFDSAQNLDLSVIRKNDVLLWPMVGSGLTARINFDGFITFTPGTHLQSSGPIESYVQVFRNGCIEAVCATMIVPRTESEQTLRLIPSEYEAYVELGVREYLTFLQKMNVEPPIFLSLSIINAGDFRLSSYGFLNEVQSSGVLGNDEILVPEIPIEAYSPTYFSHLKEPFDRVWQAGGRLESPNYSEGVWRGRRLPPHC